MTPTVAIVHPGQMGTAVAAHLSARNQPVLWCPTGRSDATQRRAMAAGLSAVDMAELVIRADVILVICPPHVATEVACAIATCGYRGIYVEANAISPTRMNTIADDLRRVDAQVIDAAIIGPPPVGQDTARLYLAGPAHLTAVITSLFAGTGVQPVYLSESLGAASALKMAYASYQKAARALAGVAHALAADYQVTEPLIAEAVRHPHSPLASPDYLPSVAVRAWRWAPEMREVAATLAEVNLPDDLAHAAAAVFARWLVDKDIAPSLGTVFDHLRVSCDVSVSGRED